jgi:hypothetical protein
MIGWQAVQIGCWFSLVLAIPARWVDEYRTGSWGDRVWSALPGKSISMVKKFCFVAERRVSLARSFKAGERRVKARDVASATIE